MSYDGESISDQEWYGAEEENWQRGLTTIPCPKCDGEGRVDEIDYARVNAFTISPPYHSVKCENCKGSGKIVIEEEDE